MREFSWIEGPGQLESLAVCLRSLCALARTQTSYDEIVAALGLGSLVAADRRHSLRDWPMLARDESLIATAEQWNVRLRELHPRRAAVGLEASAEFALHFIDSYAPLIERALACGQLALVWRGWPPPGDMQWGVISSSRDGVLRGHTLGQSASIDLIAPAQQVYIVEEISPANPPFSAADRFARAAWLLQAQESGNWGSDPGLITGSHAWREWAACLTQAEPGAGLFEMHRSAALPVAAARESLGRWLKDLTGELPAHAAQAAGFWTDLCARVVRRLHETISPPSAGPARVSTWQADSVHGLLELADLEARAAATVAPFAQAIAIRPAYEPDPLQV